ncbi:MAG: ABC transporter ATP-binding protein [bacterium]
MKIMELKDITHTYQRRKVLDIAALSIDKGRIYSLIGPNGSGKTTLLSIMGLILRPTAGEIFFEGRSVDSDKGFRLTVQRSMTMVFQDPYLFCMSVAKNITYGLRTRSLPRKVRDAKVKESLDWVGLPGFEKRGARELSGGETKLVALARALALDPAIIFLDEPTANVDTRHIHQLESVITRINRERGTTVVMTTHNLSQAYRLADMVFSLFDGAFVNSAMHNLFSGQFQQTTEGICFDTGAIRIWASSDAPAANSTHVTIDPENIIVSKEPFASSARNRFEGVITQIIEQGGKVLLEIRSQETFRVLITAHSLREIGLDIGARVFLTFKASSVNIL